MEALAGISIACNIMQVISFTHETVSLCKTIYRKGSADSDLTERTAKIQLLVEDLDSKVSRSANITDGSRNASVNAELSSLSGDVISTAKELMSELNQPASSKFEAVKKAIKTTIRQRKIERLDKKLLRLEQTLQTGLISQIWSTRDAILVGQEQGFETLDEDVKRLVQQYAQGQIQLQDFIQHENARTIASLPADLLTSISLEFEKTKQHVTQVAQSAEELQMIRHKKELLLRSVRFESRNERKTTVKPAHQKTFGWIFSAADNDPRSNFKRWLCSDDGRVFWINGKPGSGKSTLMKFLTSDGRTNELLRSKFPSHAIYSHFIWKIGNQADRSLRGMLCSFIHQILEKENNDYLAVKILQDYPEFSRKLSPSDWEMAELELTLQKLLELQRDFVVLFIDGLDELDANEDKWELKRIAETGFSSITHLKVCVSSRPEPELKLLLNDCASIRLQDLTKNDLEQVVREVLSKYPGLTLRNHSESDRDELIRLVVGKSDGVFLWITLALKSLKDGSTANDSLEQLRDRIEDIPTELNDLYHGMWERLGANGSRYQNFAAFVFKFIIEWKKWKSDHSSVPVMSFQLVLGLNKSVWEKLMSGKMDFYRSQTFLDLCSNTQRQVEFRCAGLVEFLNLEMSRSSLLKNGGNEAFLVGESITDHRTLRVDFIHRTVQDFLLGDGRSLLDHCDLEEVYLALFNSAIGEPSLLKPKSLANFSSSSSFGLRMSDEESHNYKIDFWAFTLEFKESLAAAISFCGSWMKYAREFCKEDEIASSLWHKQSHGIFKLLENAFEEHGMTNLLEQEAIWLGAVEPIIKEVADAPRSLSTYLHWQQVAPWVEGGTYRKRKSELDEQKIRTILEQSDLNWAYPNTAIAHLHGIPQLFNFPAYLMLEDELGSPRRWTFDDLLQVLRRIKQSPNDSMLVSTILGTGGSFSFLIQHGIVRVGLNEPSNLANLLNYSDVVFHVNTAMLVNCTISHLLGSSTYFQKTVAQLRDQETELKSLMYPDDQCHLKVLFVSNFKECLDTDSKPVKVFDPRRFQDYLPDPVHRSSMPRLQEYIFDEGRARYYVPTEAQSKAMLSQLNPDLLPYVLNGPAYRCFHPCCREESLDIENPERFKCWQQNRTDRLDKFKEILKQIALGDNERIYDVPGWLRQKGYYIPTEDDLLEFMGAKDTFARVAVLDRLNREKAEMEGRVQQTTIETG